MEGKQFVVFTIDDEEFALDVEKVNEIIKPIEIARVPNVPAFIEGMMNIRGKVLAIVDLRSKLGINKKDFDENTKVIIVNVKGTSVGLVVDGVREIFRVEDGKTEATPDMITKANSEFIKGVVKKQEKMMMVVDIDKVLDMVA